MQNDTAISLFVPPSHLLFGVRVSDIVLVALMLIAAALLAVIARYITPGGGERQPPWEKRRDFRRYADRHDNHHNDSI
jgi:hypothetical protein